MQEKKNDKGIYYFESHFTLSLTTIYNGSKLDLSEPAGNNKK